MKLDFFPSPSIYLFLSYKSNSWIFPFEIITLTLHRKHLYEKCTWFFIYVGLWFAQVNYLRQLWPPRPFASVVTGTLFIRKETEPQDWYAQTGSDLKTNQKALTKAWGLWVIVYVMSYWRYRYVKIFLLITSIHKHLLSFYSLLQPRNPVTHQSP